MRLQGHVAQRTHPKERREVADFPARGLRTLLCEQHDLASHTSSAATKLIHGGLRYLEHYEFRLVAEALSEREVNAYITHHAKDDLPEGVVAPHVTIVGDGRVSLKVDPEIQAVFPRHRSARVRVRLKDGSALETFRADRRGDPEDPLKPRTASLADR